MNSVRGRLPPTTMVLVVLLATGCGPRASGTVNPFESIRLIDTASAKATKLGELEKAKALLQDKLATLRRDADALDEEKTRMDVTLASAQTRLEKALELKTTFDSEKRSKSGGGITSEESKTIIDKLKKDPKYSSMIPTDLDEDRPESFGALEKSISDRVVREAADVKTMEESIDELANHIKLIRRDVATAESDVRSIENSIKEFAARELPPNTKVAIDDMTKAMDDCKVKAETLSGEAGKSLLLGRRIALVGAFVTLASATVFSIIAASFSNASDNVSASGATTIGLAVSGFVSGGAAAWAAFADRGPERTKATEILEEEKAVYTDVGKLEEKLDSFARGDLADHTGLAPIARGIQARLRRVCLPSP